MEIVDKLRREKVLGDAAVELREMQSRGEWVEFGLAAVTRTHLSRANLGPPTDRELSMLNGPSSSEASGEAQGVANVQCREESALAVLPLRSLRRCETAWFEREPGLSRTPGFLVRGLPGVADPQGSDSLLLP